MAFKRKSLVRHTRSKYLKPGTLAQLCNSKTPSRSCVKARKTGGYKDCKKVKATKKVDVLSTPIASSHEVEQPKLSHTVQIRDFSVSPCGSYIESLPMELLVEIMCHLHHDQLRAPFHVSRRFREAVIYARQRYFDYKTPDRSRQELLRMKTPLPCEHWPFRRRVVNGEANLPSNPITPKAPKHGPRLRRVNIMDLTAISTALFQDSVLPPSRPRAVLKPASSNRVLFYEDELCQAVTENKIC